MTRVQGQRFGFFLIILSLVGILSAAGIIIRHQLGVSMPPALEELFFPAVCKLPWCIPLP